MAKNFQSNGYNPYYTSSYTTGGSSPPVIYYQHPPEATPLIPRERERSNASAQVGCLFLAILIGYIVFYNAAYMAYPTCLLDPPLTANLFWDHIDAHTCTTYATREYTALLTNLPVSCVRRVEACKTTPLDIHGMSHLPKTCEDKGPGVVVGRFEIGQREPDCTTYWDEYDDKGCTSHGSGKRHFTHKLMNLPRGGDWREFCATTPIRFNNMDFPGAQECFTSIWGVYGRWEVDDVRC